MNLETIFWLTTTLIVLSLAVAAFVLPRKVQIANIPFCKCADCNKPFFTTPAILQDSKAGCLVYCDSCIVNVDYYATAMTSPYSPDQFDSLFKKASEVGATHSLGLSMPAYLVDGYPRPKEMLSPAGGIMNPSICDSVGGAKKPANCPCLLTHTHVEESLLAKALFGGLDAPMLGDG